MRKKRLGSLFLSFVMLISCFSGIQLNAFANAGLVGTDKAKVEFHYMQETNGTIQRATRPSSFAAGDSFYVGVYLKDWSNIKEVANAYYNEDESQQMTEKLGLRDLSVTFTYNQNYLTCESTQNSTLKNNSINRLTDINSPIITVSNGVYKTSYTSTHTAGSGDSLSEIQTNINDEVNPGDFVLPPYKGEQDLYLAIYKFTVSTATSNVSAFGISSDPQKVSVKFGAEFDDVSTYSGEIYNEIGYQMDLDGSDTDILTIIDFDFTDVDIFPTTYDVEYDVNGGTKATGTTDADYKESVAKNSTPSGKNNSGVEVSTLITPPTGKIFKAWSKNASSEVALTAITGDSDKYDKVYAIYTDGHKLTFNLNGGDTFADGTTTTLAPITKGAGKAFLSSTETIASVTKGGDPIRAGYTFKGWYEKDTTTNTFKSHKFVDTDLQDTDNTDNTEDSEKNNIDLYAMWELSTGNDAVLKFDKNGGATDATPTSVAFATTDATSKVPDLAGGMPAEPTKSNYVFKGWYKNKFGLGTELDKDTIVSTYTNDILDSTKTPKEATVYARYDSDDANKIEIKFAEDTTGSGQYGGGTCTATNSATIPSYYVNYGDKIDALPDSTVMTHSTKVFDGWYTQADGKGTKVVAGTTAIDQTLDSNTSLAANTPNQVVTLYPYWVTELEVKYNANALPTTAYTSGMPTDSAKYKPNDADFIPKTFTSTDVKYTVKEWNTKPNGSGKSYKLDGTKQAFPAGDTDDDDTTDGTVTLYAIWDYDVNQTDAVSITFKANDDNSINAATLNPADTGSSSKTYTIVRLAGTTIDTNHLPTATRDKYKFDHWGKTANEALTVVQDLAVSDESGSNAKTMTRYAIWDIDTTDTYDVTFEINKPNNTGTANPANDFTVQVPQGDCLGSRMPADPTFTGYAFEKWTYKSGGSGDFDATKTVTANTTVEANWKQEVTVTYDLNGLPTSDTAPALQKGTPGTNFTVATPTITGTYAAKANAEWNTEKNGSGDSYKAGDSKALPNADTTLYLIWDYTDTDKIAITFNGNGTTQFAATLNPKNASDDDYTIYRAPNTTISADHLPTAKRTAASNEYTFDHWGKTANEALTVAQDLAVSDESGSNAKTMTRYAIWKDPTNKVTISFNMNEQGGKTASPSSITAVELTSGDSLGTQYPADPTMDGYSFVKWYKSTDTTNKTAVTSTDTFSGDTTLVAEWEAKVDLKYDKNGLDASDFSSFPTDETGLTPGTSKTVAGAAIATGSKNILRKDSGKIVWNTEPNGSGTTYLEGASITVSSNTTLYAMWDYDENENDAVKITFKGNGTSKFAATLNPADSGKTDEYTMVRKAGTVKANQLPKATRTDANNEYTFDHWNKNAGAAPTTAADDNIDITVAADPAGSKALTLYAIWGAPTNPVTVKFDLSEPAGTANPSSIDDVILQSGDVLGSRYPADPTLTGYTFVKWYKDGDASETAIDKDNTIFTDATTTLKAKWQQTVSLEYDMNGLQASDFATNGFPTDETGITPGTSKNVAGATLASGATYTLKTDGGKVVWNTEPNGSGTPYKEGDAITVSANTKLYLMWDYNGPNAVTVTFKGNDTNSQFAATLTPNNGTQTNEYTMVRQSGTTIPVNQQPTAKRTTANNEYTFSNYDKSATAAASAQAAIIVAEDTTGSGTMTLYAIWTATDPITITFDLKTPTDATSTPTAISAVTIQKNDSLGTKYPTDPVAGGYTFKGWLQQGTTTPLVTASTPTFASNTTLEAQWEKTVSLKYDMNGLTSADFAANGFPQDETGIVPGTSKTVAGVSMAASSQNVFKNNGSGKVAWNTEPNGTGTTYYEDASITVNSDTTLYAMWDYNGADKIEVTYNGNGAATYKGYVYPPSVDTPTQNLAETYVVYRKPGYVIKKAEMPDAKRTNYTFDHWAETATEAALASGATQGDITVADKTSDNTKKMTIYAIWSSPTSPITVSFTMNEPAGTANPSSIATVTIASGDSLGNLFPSDPTLTGYSFEKWYDSTDATNKTKVTKDTTFTQNTTLVAEWAANITVKYDVNGGTAGSGPADVTKAASADYVDVTTTPAYTGPNGAYTFVGWNTKQNGSGYYIKAGVKPDTNSGTLKYSDLLTYTGATGSTVTLYAIWAAVAPGDIGGVPGGTADPDPTLKGVKVTFDSNANIPKAATGTDTVTNAKPGVLYPQYGATIVKDKMPDAPTRTNYEIASWNTKPDGSGITVYDYTTPDAATKAFDTTALGTELVETPAGSSKYEITLYAQWKLKSTVPAANKVTLTFNNNLDGKGASTDAFTIDLFNGDALGYTPAKSTASSKDKFDFIGWFKADASSPDANGKVIMTQQTSSEFNPNAPVTADETYYSMWKLYLIAEIQGTVPGQGTTTIPGAIYTGSQIKPNFKFYSIKPASYAQFKAGNYTLIPADYELYDGGASGMDISASTDYTATYYADTDTQKTTPKTLQDAGDYIVDVKMNAASAKAIEGAEISLIDPDEYTVTKAQWIVKVDPDTQEKEKTAAAVTGPTIEVYESDGTTPVASTNYTVTYRKIIGDADGDNDIDPADDLDTGSTTVPQDVAKYVIEVEPVDTANYQIGSVTTTTVGQNVKVYSKTQAAATDPDPSYTAAVGVGKNIYFRIKANDPSADTLTAELTVQPTGSPLPSPTTTPASLKDNDFKTTKAFNNSKTATGTDLEYYIIAPKDGTKVTLTVTPKYDTTVVSATYGKDTATATASGAPTATINDGTAAAGSTIKPQIITVDLSTTDPDTVVAVKTATPDGSISMTYLVTVRRDQSGIELKYGNSPYAMIEKMRTDVSDPWDETKIADAKTKFNAGNKFVTNYIPTDGVRNKLYSPKAWGSASNPNFNVNDPEMNYDRNLYAIFVYNKSTFKDPGFTATDAAGNPVAATDITRTMTVKRMPKNTTANLKDSKVTDDTITVTNAVSNASISLGTKGIRPDSYTMTYTFTDPVTGETVSVDRHVIVIWALGDADVSSIVNTGDASTVTSYVKGVSKITAGVDTKAANVYLYRVADADRSGIVNTGDASTITSIVKGVSKAYPWYIELK